MLSSLPLLLRLQQFPLLSEESRVNDLARRARIGRDVHVNHGVIGQLGNLARVVQLIVFAKRETAVEHHIFLRVQRVGINQDRHVVIG